MKSNPTAGILLLLFGALIITQGPQLLTKLFGNVSFSAEDANAAQGFGAGDITPDKGTYQSGGPSDPDAKNPSVPGVTNTSTRWPGAYVGEKGAVVVSV